MRHLWAMCIRKEHYLSKINELIQGVESCTLTSVIDLNMGYLTIPLDEEPRKILTIAFPCGCFECLVLPKWVKLKPAMGFFKQEWLAFFKHVGAKTAAIPRWYTYFILRVLLSVRTTYESSAVRSCSEQRNSGHISEGAWGSGHSKHIQQSTRQGTNTTIYTHPGGEEGIAGRVRGKEKNKENEEKDKESNNK